MAHVEGEITIERPVDEVFDFVADERNEPRYNPRMTRADKMSPGPIGAGTRYKAQLMTRGRRIEMTIETTGYDRPRRLASSTWLAAMTVHGALTFEPIPGGTLMHWSWDLEPQGLMKLMSPLIASQGRRQEKEVWTGLKQLMESGRTSAGLPPDA
jgi:polyketide cyclase/dehydrase/lipid transport protein